MKALLLKAFNTDYSLEEVPMPRPSAGQVLVQIKASGINPLDLKIKTGEAAHARQQLPAIPGIDMAGIVVSLGAGVTGFRPGDEVFGMTGGIAGIPGTLAQYTAADARLLAHKPATLSMREAAALPLAFITAWEALIDRAHTQAGQTVLIHGGAGGVGHMAIQIAKAQDAIVFATAQPQHHALIRSYGATPVDYTQLSPEAYFQQYTHGQGFDIILDTVGGTTLDDSFKVAKQYTGHVISILGWGTHNLAPLSFRGATYSGVFTLYPLLSGKGREHHGDILRAAATLANEGKLRPRLDSTPYTLTTIEQAYQAIISGNTTGKVVIDIEQQP